MKIKEFTKTRKVIMLDKKRMSEFLKNNYNAISKFKFEEKFAHPSYKKLQSKFLNIVDDELPLSYRSYEMGSFPFAVYHLQQSVEKLVKAWMLSGGITYEKLRKDSHNTNAIFMGFFKSNSSQILEIAEVYGKKNVMLELLQKINKLNTSRSYEIAKISKDQIDFFLKKLSDVRAKGEFSSETLDIWYDYLHDLFIDLPQNKFEIDKDSLRKTLGPDFFLKFYNYQVSFLSLFILSFLTYSHDSWTRYPKNPEGSKDVLEYDDYEHGLGIVDRTIQLLNLCSQCKNDFVDFNVKDITKTMAELKYVFLDDHLSNKS